METPATFNRLRLFNEILGSPRRSPRNSWEWEYLCMELDDIGSMDIKIELFDQELEIMDTEEDDIRNCDFSLEMTIFGDYVKSVYGPYDEIIEALKEENERFNMEIYELDHLEEYED